MRKAPWPMRRPQHHSRPLADRTHRARRSRPGPQRPATHARPVQALPRQQDRKDETFRLQQQTKPQLTHTGFGTKTKHSIEAEPTTPAAHVERHERRKRPSLLDSIRDSSQQQASQTKNRCKTNGSKPSKHPRGYPLTVWVAEPPESCLRGAESSKVSEGAGERPCVPQRRNGARPSDDGGAMPRGGKRVRSGPMPDPSSGASERRGYTLRSLPNTEYKGRPPKFPLPPYVLRDFDKDSQEWVEDKAGSESWNERESELWGQLWRLPQARAWKQPQLKYLHYQIASYVRECVVCESPSAKAADVAVKIRLEDRIGLSEAGLQALGWKISEDNVDMAAHEVPATDAEASESGMNTKIVQFPRRLRA
nr:MAG TPA: hypothetical protein [Caudoviricetes sp.]